MQRVPTEAERHKEPQTSKIISLAMSTMALGELVHCFYLSSKLLSTDDLLNTASTNNSDEDALTFIEHLTNVL